MRRSNNSDPSLNPQSIEQPVVNIADNIQWQLDEIRAEQLKDPDIAPIMLQVEQNRSRPNWQMISAESENAKMLWAQYDRLQVQNGMLYRRWENTESTVVTWQIIIPKVKQCELLKMAHDDPMGGHLGGDKTLAKLYQVCFWVNVKDDVRRYVECVTVVLRKLPKAPMKEYVTGSAMERITKDILGPLDRTASGKKYILCITCAFTKWTEAYALANIEAKTVAKKIVEEWICHYGVPMIIHTDQGRQFEAKLFQELCQLLGVQKTRTTALRPQANGQVERFNRTLSVMLSIYSSENPKYWDRALPYVMAAYRSVKHESTGFTLNTMMFGRELTLLFT